MIVNRAASKHQSFTQDARILPRYYQGDEVKRDMELVRRILLDIEADPKLDGNSFATITLPGYEDEEVAYVLTLLIKDGLVIGHTTMENPLVSRLTWEGHELLDNIRADTVWEATKDRAKAVGSVSLRILAELATSEIKKRLGLP